MFQKLKEYLLIKLGITELRHDLQQAEKRLDDRFEFLGSYMNLIQAEELSIDKNLSAKVESRLKKEFGLSSVNMTTHKNDIMFAIHLFEHRHDVQKAIYSHFKVGGRTAANLKSLCEKEGLSKQKILDFGSGYGRVSRFLPTHFQDAEILVSEVKEQALAFQKRHFGFEGLFHNQDPKSLQANGFDLILALSVFTHLPKVSFQAWLQHLIAMLSPGGALIFTFNNGDDAKYQESYEKQDFSFQLASEDSKFSFIADSLNDTHEYGNTFISHSFLKGLLDYEGLSYQFLGYEFSPAQETILIKKEII
jgi:2-polyprenyl-3-methyl-5-hydroxy-6-metoxy-1,4-benzoquinol methylase